MDNHLNLPYPHSGVNEVMSATDKPESFSHDEQNMRSLNPRTGKLKGAQRAGLAAATTASAPSATPVQALAGLVWDSRKVTYVEIEPQNVLAVSNDILFGVQTPNKAECIAGAIDFDGNVYLIENGSSLCKYNQDGELVWRIPLPLKEIGQLCRALAVDDGLNVYVGTSSGNEQSKSRLWAYRQLDDDKTERLWEMENVGFIEKVSVRDGVLHTLQNFPDEALSKIVVYTSLQSSQPDLDWERTAPYPANDMFVRPSDGSIFVASPANPSRGISPKYPNFTQRTVDWTPLDLVDAEKRIYSWYDATTIEDFKEDDPLPFWRDLSGGGRHLVQSDVTMQPLYDEKAARGHAGVRFTRAPLQFNTAVNPDVDLQYIDQFKTVIPTATTSNTDESSKFIMFVVGRCSANNIDNPSVFMTQYQHELSNVAFKGFWVIVNGTSNGGSAALTSSTGSVAVTMMTHNVKGGYGPSGGGLNGQPLAGSFLAGGNDTRMFLLTILVDGRQDPNLEETQHSVLRVNGRPTDRFLSEKFTTIDPTYIGSSNGLGGNMTPLNRYAGHALEIITLEQYTDGGEHGNPCTGAYNSVDDSHYPRTIGVPAGGPAAAVGVNWQADEDNSFNDLEMERIEGYLMHKWGISHLLPGGAATPTTNGPYSVGNYPHPYSTNAVYAFGPPRRVGNLYDGDESKEWLLNSDQAILAKFGPNRGEVKWVITYRDTQNYAGSTLDIPAAETDDLGGIGYGVACDDTTGVFSIGPIRAGAADGEQVAFVRKIIDEGDTYSIDEADGAWQFNSKVNGVGETHGLGITTVEVEPDYQYPRMGVDRYGNLHVPWFETDQLDAATYAFISNDGTKHFKFNLDGSNNCPQAMVCIPTNISPDLTGAIQTRVDSVFLLTNHARGVVSLETPTFYLIRQLHQNHTGGPNRAVTRLTIVNGGLYRIEPTAITAPAGTDTLITPQFGLTVPFVSNTVFNQEMFFTDGINLRVYNARADTILPYKAKKSGKIPQRCKFIATWRGRIVLARSADEPQNWFMSEVSQPYHWDFSPPVVTSTTAAFGSQTLAGLCPDIINAVIPINDDLLIMGGDHSIWRLTGDPMVGGQWDMVSDVTGIAFGKAWAKDESGTLYFFGSRGGVWMMRPGGLPEPMTRLSIENRLSNLDLNTSRVELHWNSEDDGLHVFVFQNEVEVNMTHFFWERKTNAWHPDKFGSVEIEPTAACVFDGDLPEDRTLWIGGADGVVRRWDRSAVTDDGVNIDSYVTMFPVGPKLDGREYRFRRLSCVLSKNEGGATFEGFASQAQDDIGDPIANGVLDPGRNESQPFLARGAFVGLRLRNSGAEAWGFESASVRFVQAGRERAR